MSLFSEATKVSRTVGLPTVLLAVSVFAAACGTSDVAGGAGGAAVSSDTIAAAKASVQEAEKAPTQIPVSVPLSKKAPTGKVVVFLKDPTAPSQEIFDGLQEAVDAVGWTLKVIKFDPSDISTLNSGLVQALGVGADYVVESGFAESLLSKSTVAKFKAAGVPIIVSGATPVRATETLIGSYGDQNFRIVGGQQLGDWLIADSKGKGNAVIVNITTYATLTLFAKTFADHVAKLCSSCKTETLSVTLSDVFDGTLTTNVIAKLRANRSIKYVVLDNSGEMGGLDAAFKAAGLDDVKIIGASIDPVTVKSLKSGKAEAFIANSFRFAGWDAIDLALRYSVGDKTSFPKVATPSQLITKTNVDSLPANALFRGPGDALEQYKKLWLVAAS